MTKSRLANDRCPLHSSKERAAMLAHGHANQQSHMFPCQQPSRAAHLVRQCLGLLQALDQSAVLCEVALCSAQLASRPSSNSRSLMMNSEFCRGAAQVRRGAGKVGTMQVACPAGTCMQLEPHLAAALPAAARPGLPSSTPQAAPAPQPVASALVSIPQRQLSSSAPAQ